MKLRLALFLSAAAVSNASAQVTPILEQNTSTGGLYVLDLQGVYDIIGTSDGAGNFTPRLFSSTLGGAVPASGGGVVNFLRSDGSWVVPAGIIGTAFIQDYIAGTGFTPGTTTTLTVTSPPSAVAGLSVYFDGVRQSFNTWTLSGSTLTFNAPIPFNVQVVEVQTGVAAGNGGVNSGLINQVAYYAASGQIVQGANIANFFTAGTDITFSGTTNLTIGLTSNSLTLGSTLLTLGGTVTSVSGLTLSGPTFSGTVTISGLSTQGVVCNSGAGVLSTSTTGCANTIQSGALGGTGVANTSKTITLGASLTTTGAAASTLAFGAAGNTYTFPNAAITIAGVNLAETWTALQTFTNSDLALLGSSTGATTFASANASATNYTITFPAATGTVALTSGANVASVTNSDGTLTISPTTGAVVASCTVATTGQIGCVKPDGTIITDTAGAITVAKASASAFGVVEIGGGLNVTAGVISIPGAAGQILNGATPSLTATPTLGASGTLGSLTMGNATSGTVTIEPVTGALGTVTVLIPAVNDTLVALAATQTLTNKTISGSSNTLSNIALSSLATEAASTVVGNVTGSTASPTALTTTQLTTLVNVFTSSLSGAVPASGGGTTNFLRADGSWAAPPGGGGGETVSKQDFIAGTNFTAGTTTSLTVTSAPGTTSKLTIYFDGVYQNSNTWSLSGSVITFSAAIPFNVQVVETISLS